MGVAVSLRAPEFEALEVPEEEKDGVKVFLDEIVCLALKDLEFDDSAETENWAEIEFVAEDKGDTLTDGLIDGLEELVEHRVNVWVPEVEVLEDMDIESVFVDEEVSETSIEEVILYVGEFV